MIVVVIIVIIQSCSEVLHTLKHSKHVSQRTVSSRLVNSELFCYFYQIGTSTFSRKRAPRELVSGAPIRQRSISLVDIHHDEVSHQPPHPI